jgi:hypothetical protein
VSKSPTESAVELISFAGWPPSSRVIGLAMRTTTAMPSSGMGREGSADSSMSCDRIPASRNALATVASVVQTS